MKQLRTHRETFLIGGEWQAPSVAAATIDVFNSATGELLGAVPAGSVEDIDKAVKAAHAAFEGWAETPPWVRANYLKAIREYLADRLEEIAELIALEVGTPLRMAQRIQVGLPLATLEGFIEVAQTAEWETRIAHSIVRREPAGVVGAITPWNYPLHQLVGKVGGALAAGCTVVAKPADIAPLSAYYLADAAKAAGLPPGVFNLVSGPGRVLGEALVSHPQVDMVSFTGSTAVGARIAALAAQNITRVALELGGKSASVVLDDADFERAVRTSTNNCFLNSGQTCSAWTRLLVPRKRQQQAIEVASSTAEKLSLGHPLSADARLGPLASRQQKERVEDIIAKARERGDGRVVYEGRVPEGAGYFVAPVIFADVDPDSALAQEEVFGPVLAIIPHDGDEHAIGIANNSLYGLSGAVWSVDEKRALAAARRIRSGQIDINGAAFNPKAPFGGYRQSGYGREFGMHGIEDFTVLKSIQGRDVP